MNVQIPFLSPGFIGVMLVAAIILGSLLPTPYKKWWSVLGGGLTAASLAALIGIVSWAGDMHITGYSVMMLLAFIAAYVVTIPRARIVGISERTIIDMALLALIGGIVGSRFGEVVEQWPKFGKDAHGNSLTISAFINKLMDFDNGGMVWYGGAILAAILILILAKRRKLRLLEVSDLLMPATLLGLGTGRVGCFLNGCCYGGPTDAPWAVANPFGVKSHPTQLYETIACVSLFAFTFWWWRRRRYQGEVFFIGLFGYALWRFINEGLRGDTVESTFLGLWTVTTSQAVSLYLACVGMALALVVIIRRKQSPELSAIGRDVPGSCHQRSKSAADPVQQQPSKPHHS